MDATGPDQIDWAAVLARHDRWLRLVVLARLKEAQAVDEVMQEISLAAVAQRSPLADPAKVAAWLYRLAIRQTLLFCRGRGRQRRLVDRYFERGNDDERVSADPLDWLVLQERAVLVRQALSRLPGRDAEILMLKYAESWSYRELADHLGVSVSAIEARLHRGRRRLRDELTLANVIEVHK